MCARFFEKSKSKQNKSKHAFVKMTDRAVRYPRMKIHISKVNCVCVRGVCARIEK